MDNGAKDCGGNEAGECERRRVFATRPTTHSLGNFRWRKAVLVAIAIPVFTSQLEKSRDAVTISNIRAAYAEASTAMLTSNGKAVAETNNVTVAEASGGKQQVTVKNVAFKGQANGFSDMEDELAFTHTIMTDSSTEGATPGNYTLVFEFDTATGACTLNSMTKA